MFKKLFLLLILYSFPYVHGMNTSKTLKESSKSKLNPIVYSFLADHLSSVKIGQWEYTYFCSLRTKKFFITLNNRPNIVGAHTIGLLIDTATGNELGRWENVCSGSLSNDGERLFIMFQDYTGLLIDTNTGNELGRWKNVNKYKFSGDGKKLFITFQDENNIELLTGVLIDTNTGNNLGQWENVDEGCLSNDGKKLFIMRKDNTGKGVGILIDIDTGNELGRWREVQWYSNTFSANGKRLFISFNDSSGVLIDTDTGNELRRWANVDSGIGFSNDGKKLIVGYSPFIINRLCLIDTETGNELGRWDNVGEKSLGGNKLFIKFLADRSYLSNKPTASYFNSVLFGNLFIGALIDINTGNELRQWNGVTEGSLSDDGKKLFIVSFLGNFDKKLTGQLIDTETGNEIARWENMNWGKTDSNSGIDGKRLWIKKNGTTVLYNLEKLDEIISKLNIKQFQFLNGIVEVIRGAHNKRMNHKDPNLSPVQITPDKEQLATFNSLPQEIKQILSHRYKGHSQFRWLDAYQS